MKTAIVKTDSQKVDSILQMARLRVEVAENRWAKTKEEAREAKRKRKEAKVIARRAKKEAKRAKAELAEARNSLAEAEAKLATPVVPVAKARKGQPVASDLLAVSDPVAQVIPALEPADAASIAFPQAGSVVESPPEATPPGILGNWR
ncbi:MAG: hypothetical protein NT154_38465 [Verrucomicrobia bacterium]|nr:hypothetical protein [Verrucomicrobiota bacterium]